MCHSPYPQDSVKARTRLCQLLSVWNIVLIRVLTNPNKVGSDKNSDITKSLLCTKAHNTYIEEGKVDSWMSLSLLDETILWAIAVGTAYVTAVLDQKTN